MRDFHDLKVWQAAHQLTLAVYKLTRRFPVDERFGLTSQLRRASASIGANLAEGCGRWSEGDLLRSLQIAMGSASELAYHLLLARDLGFFTAADHGELQGQLASVRRMLTAFYQKVGASKRKQERQPAAVVTSA